MANQILLKRRVIAQQVIYSLLPWRPNQPILPSNHTCCKCQMQTLARKLGRQPTLLKLNGNIIAEQEQRQFI